jgi:hypothetical protein
VRKQTADSSPAEKAYGTMKTRWAKDVSQTLPHPEYPRPQLARENWINLNGWWNYGISPADGGVLDIDAGHRGPAADIQLYRGSKLDETLPAELRDKPRYGDKAYADQKQPEITTPKKKPKGGELTPAEKERNREISRQRIAVEHSIRRVKGFGTLRDQYRLPTGIFPTVASAVVGLIHFSNCLA